MSEITYRGTRDSVTVVIDGETYTVRKGTANYRPLMAALAEGRMADVPGLVSVRKTIESWASGKFKVVDKAIQFEGDAVPAGVSKRIMAMITADEDPSPLLNFYERLDRNPSSRSVEQLFNFIQHDGIPIEPDGTFLAYKSVRSDCKDHHSGTVDYTPAKDGDDPKVVQVKRNKVSDDPEHACHFGLHVGALEYARTFGYGGKIIICRIDPEHVVSVPKDCSQHKMRVCKLEVVGYWNGKKMPSTTMTTDDRQPVPTPAKPEDKGKDMPKAKAKAKGQAQPKFVPDRNLKRKWARWDQRDEVSLLDLDLMELRKYATYHIMLVGASKIRGGKPALVRSIIEVRDGEGHK